MGSAQRRGVGRTVKVGTGLRGSGRLGRVWPSSAITGTSSAWRVGEKKRLGVRQAGAPREGQEGKFRDASDLERSRREGATRTHRHKQGYFPEGTWQGGGETGIWEEGEKETGGYQKSI